MIEKQPAPRRVTHLIIGLDLGGAETMLYQLLQHRTRDDIVYNVISLGVGDYYKPLIEELDIPVTILNLRKKPLSSFYRLKKQLKKTDVLCSWMYHSNLIGYFALGFSRKNKKLIWNIRHSNLDNDKNKARTLRINRICAHISKNVDVVIYNGKEAMKTHQRVGYAPRKSIVLGNGCDVSKFVPDKTQSEQVREELGIEKNKTVVLSVSRDAPIKDVPNFVKSFARVHEKHPEMVAVMCGEGIDEKNLKLTTMLKELNLVLKKDVFLVGRRSDIHRLFNAADIYVLHSAGEAFPNVLIQAMACESLCVTTDVGEAREILDDDALVVEPENPEKLADVIERVLDLTETEKEEKQKKNRLIVLDKYDITSVCKDYEKAFDL